MKADDEFPPFPLSAGRAEAPRREFTTTHWSVVLMAGQENSSTAAAALENLCRSYWYPLYAYARRNGRSPEDCQDLTQQFFAGFLDKKYFRLADPDRGRFRSFLLASFKHFLANEYNRSRTVKRGGRQTFVSWDEVHAESNYRNEPVTEASPDKLYERAWVLALLDKVMKKLRQDYARTGKGRIFERLQVFLSGEKSEATYSEIAGDLQMGESGVKMAVLRLRQKYGELLRAEVAHTVMGPEQVEEELRHLICTLSG